jgi:hypothetical protein
MSQNVHAVVLLYVALCWNMLLYLLYKGPHYCFMLSYRILTEKCVPGAVWEYRAMDVRTTALIESVPELRACGPGAC